jgi:hypothetical protein
LTGINQVLKLSWQIANSGKNSEELNNNENKTLLQTDDKTKLQALSLINDCYKYIIDLTTNGVVITDAIKLVQNSKEKLNVSKEDVKKSEESDYDNEDKEQLEEEQEKGELTTTNQIF